MKQLTRYQPSQQHREFVKRSGFDFDNPDRRLQVQNHVIDHLLDVDSHSNDQRKDELLRQWQSHNHYLTRAVTFGGILLFAGTTGEHAIAAELETSVSDWAPVYVQIAEWCRRFFESFHALSMIIWIVWGVLVIILLSSIQALLLAQQNRILRAVVANNSSEALIMANTIDAPASKDGCDIITSQHRWSVSCASRTGKMREENQDRYRTVKFSPSELALIVCDGAGGHRGGGEAAELAAATIKASIEDNAGMVDSIASLRHALNEAQNALQASDLEGITTAIVARLQGNWLHFATLGDGNLSVIWPDGMVSQHLIPHHTFGEPKNRIAGFVGRGCEIPPRLGSVQLESGCQVLVMSDGAGDLFPFEDFARQRDKYRARLEAPENHVAAHLLHQFEEARHPENGAYFHRDNMTLLMATLRQADRTEV